MIFRCVDWCLKFYHEQNILFKVSFFFQVCGEKRRFEKLMEYFRKGESNMDFMVKPEIRSKKDFFK